MRNLLFLLIGIIGGAVLLFLGYQQLQTLQDERYIQTTTSTIVEKLQSVQQLTTATMTVSKIIEAKKDFSDLIPGFPLDTGVRNFLFGDKLLMTVEGVVNAGIDLSKIGSGNIIVTTKDNQSIVQIDLPQAEIINVYLTEKTKPFERSLGLLSKGDVELETKMRNTAIESIKKEALSGNLLQTATINAQSTIRDLISKLGNNFVIEYK